MDEIRRLLAESQVEGMMSSDVIQLLTDAIALLVDEVERLDAQIRG